MHIFSAGSPRWVFIFKFMQHKSLQVPFELQFELLIFVYFTDKGWSEERIKFHQLCL